MTQTHKNTCPAFFLDATTNSSGSYSPCTALGGGAFKFPEQTFKVTWTKEKDEYRKENFIDMFIEFGQILIDHKEW